MSRNLPIVFAAYPLLLSGMAFIGLLQSRYWVPWPLRILASGSIVSFTFLTGPWAFTSYYLRYVVFGLFVVAAVVFYRKITYPTDGGAARRGVIVYLVALVFVVFTVLDALALASYYPPDKKIGVSFPLASGTYYVLQGGNNVVTNPFHALSGNDMALDIVKLNAFGNRAKGIAPTALSAYAIFGDTLYSPCEGSVLRVRDGLPDNPPDNPDIKRPEGNYIALKCTGAEVLMAHLKQGSIKVLPGETVSVGQAIAEIGNSGNTLEPHLHIEVKDAGKEAGLLFNGRLLSVNSIVTSKKMIHRRER